MSAMSDESRKLALALRDMCSSSLFNPALYYDPEPGFEDVDADEVLPAIVVGNAYARLLCVK
jgi:hypothetical protein